mmetsp:Transcript_57499/g.129045  ORF Transcript_57499/g.129045 Transcript_57499/m.129045 type:complete len:270 (-) Transcript_57499:262-1071(-)
MSYALADPNSLGISCANSDVDSDPSASKSKTWKNSFNASSSSPATCITCLNAGMSKPLVNSASVILPFLFTSSLMNRSLSFRASRARSLSSSRSWFSLSICTIRSELFTMTPVTKFSNTYTLTAWKTKKKIHTPCCRSISSSMRSAAPSANKNRVIAKTASFTVLNIVTACSSESEMSSHKELRPMSCTANTANNITVNAANTHDQAKVNMEACNPIKSSQIVLRCGTSLSASKPRPNPSHRIKISGGTALSSQMIAKKMVASKTTQDR